MTEAGERRRTLTVTPAGVIATIMLAIVIGVMIRLGFWQLDRLAERRALNDGIAARLEAPPIDNVAALADTTGLFHRVATARGVYDNARTIVLPGRSHRGVPGVHILSPLRLEGSTDAVLVNRGWVPSADAATVPLEQLAIDSAVTVRGLVVPFPGAAQSLAPSERARTGGSAFRTVW
jgi:surfeit locus 1 family protein